MRFSHSRAAARSVTVACLAMCLFSGCQRTQPDLPLTLPAPGLLGGTGGTGGAGNGADISGSLDVVGQRLVSGPIAGQVSFLEPDREVQVKMRDVARAATVSLINASSNQTLATTLTDQNGAFSLDVRAIPATAQVYYLEGLKGLQNNSVGADVVRVRTFITYDFASETWKSLTSASAGEKLRINASTTAITVLTSLRSGGPTPVDPAGLIGKLKVTDGNPPTEQFFDAGTGITQSELQTVQSLVAESMAADADPFDAVLLKGGQYQLRSYVAAAGEPLRISHLVPTVASPGDTVEIHGFGFVAPPGTGVKFAGNLAAEIIGATSVKLTVVVPSGATTGNVLVETANASSSAAITINQFISGGFNP